MKPLVFLIIIKVFAIAKIADAYTVTEEWLKEFNKNTADRISEHGYTVDHHHIETLDHYVLSAFRLPYSHHLQNQQTRRPAILVLHGLTGSSDDFILSGPNDALAYNLVDAGYDVWLGNARGSHYSRNNTRLSPKHPHFWRFSWHEIGIYDVAAMIDYILSVTGERQLHYVGHSQGTTAFFVLMSLKTDYNAKISTAHMLAPVAFMSHMSTFVARYTRDFMGRANRMSRILDTMEVLPSTMFYVNIQETYCKHNPVLWFMCSNLYSLIGGDDGSNGNMNMTVAARLNETHPAGASSTQMLHYQQEFVSGCFCQLDHGEKRNMRLYGQRSPPDYDVSLITANMFFYYADADRTANYTDVEYLAAQLQRQPVMFRVPDTTFTHTDFVLAMQVREVINERIISACNAYEASIK